MDNPATQDNSELSTKHRTEKTERETRMDNPATHDNSELSTKHRTKKTDRDQEWTIQRLKTTVN